MQNEEVVHKDVDVQLRKNDHLLLSGPNGI
jgi:ABC-type Mn2+/Zn2+ transport system ATPase subunit